MIGFLKQQRNKRQSDDERDCHCVTLNPPPPHHYHYHYHFLNNTHTLFSFLFLFWALGLPSLPPCFSLLFSSISFFTDFGAQFLSWVRAKLVSFLFFGYQSEFLFFYFFLESYSNTTLFHLSNSLFFFLLPSLSQQQEREREREREIQLGLVHIPLLSYG